MRRVLPLAHVLLLVNGVLFAAIYAFAKVAAQAGVTPLGLLAWQVLFAAVVIGAIAAALGELPELSALNLRYAAVAGVLGVTGPNLVTFAAAAHLPVGVIGAITALSPLMTYSIAVGARVEQADPVRAAGIVLGLAGVLAITMPRGSLLDAQAAPWAIAALLAPLLLAGGNVFRTVAWPAGLRPLSAAALLLALQAVALVPLALSFGEFAMPRLPAARADVALAAAGALTAAFYLGAFELQKRGGPVIVGQLGYVITIASLAIGALAFGERYPATMLLAVGAVLAGLVLVHRRPFAAGAAR